jgi:hypothetical protein
MASTKNATETGDKDIPQSVYLKIPSSWSRVLLEKLTVTQLFKKFPAFYGTRRFLTMFT